LWEKNIENVIAALIHDSGKLLVDLVQADDTTGPCLENTD
jgi:hypothetical protein